MHLAVFLLPYFLKTEKAEFESIWCVQVASQVDFGFVPTKETVKRTLVVKNTGDLEVRQQIMSLCHACTPRMKPEVYFVLT